MQKGQKKKLIKEVHLIILYIGGVSGFGFRVYYSRTLIKLKQSPALINLKQVKLQVFCVRKENNYQVLYVSRKERRERKVFSITYHACAGGVASFATTRERRGGRGKRSTCVCRDIRQGRVGGGGWRGGRT